VKSPTRKKAKSRRRTPAKAGREGGLLATGKQLGAAFRTGDKKTVARLTDAQFISIDESGREHSKAAVLRNLKALVSSGAERGVKIRNYGRVARITSHGKSADKADVFTLDVWIKDNNGWRLLIHHDNVLAGKHEPSAHAASQPRPPDAPPPECRNPLQFVPYRPKSPDERGIINSFQQLETAVTRNDADEWVKYVADEFVVTRMRQHPTTKAQRAAFLRRQRTINAETFVAEVKRMRLWVLGDLAVMRADHVMPGMRRPPYRATRLWVKRNGRWQMALSQQTTIAA
jgi:ketosteroid isomerase-like protein